MFEIAMNCATGVGKYSYFVYMHETKAARSFTACTNNESQAFRQVSHVLYLIVSLRLDDLFIGIDSSDLALVYHFMISCCTKCFSSRLRISFRL